MKRAGHGRLGIAGSGDADFGASLLGAIAGLGARLRRPRSYPGMRAFLLAVALFATMPLAGLLIFASGGDAELWRHLAAYVLPQAFVDTVLLLIGIAVLAGLLGAGTAWTVASFRFPGRDTLGWLLPLPLAFPAYIVAYIYVDFLDAFGPVQAALRNVFVWSSAGIWFPNIRSLGGAIFVMSIVLYPYVYLAVRAMLATQSISTLEIARLLGASRWRIARDLSLPLARPAIAAGLSLAMLEALNDIGACEYLGVRTLTLSVFTTWLNRGSLAGAAQISCIMVLMIVAIMTMERYARRRRCYTGNERRVAADLAQPLRGLSRWLAFAVCATPVALGFAIPFVFLAHEAVTRSMRNGIDPALVDHTLTTFAFAAIATVLTLGLGFGAAIVARLLQRPFSAICVTMGGLGYAIPGTVLALGLLAPLMLADQAINSAVKTLAGANNTLILTSSGAAVVIAYVIRFLAIPIGFAQSGLARIATDLDDAAKSAGAPPGHVARSIHLPLLRPALAGAALLVFVDSLKELPATLLLRPLNVETLSTYVYQYATRGSFEDGALAALLIVAISILPAARMLHYAQSATCRAEGGQAGA